MGVIGAAVFPAFLWLLAGRPADAPPHWRRERPLTIVIDNYSVHRSTRVQAEAVRLAAADVHLF